MLTLLAHIASCLSSHSCGTPVTSPVLGHDLCLRHEVLELVLVEEVEATALHCHNLIQRNAPRPVARITYMSFIYQVMIIVKIGLRQTQFQ